ncbi:hypothetical protein ABFX02_08G015900 [Erythranthe guttata]
MAVLAFVLIFAIATATATATASPAYTSTTDPKELAAAAAAARALVNASSWGVVSSINYLEKSSPFGNALSYSDGGSGTPYFYLTLLDMVTANFSRADARSSLSLSEYALGTCGTLDPQEPTCVKVTLSGVLKKLDQESEEGKFANATLFERHPRFKFLPPVAKFQLYKLEIKSVFVLNGYGEPKFPSVKMYRKIKLVE